MLTVVPQREDGKLFLTSTLKPDEARLHGVSLAPGIHPDHMQPIAHFLLLSVFN